MKGSPKDNKSFENFLKDTIPVGKCANIEVHSGNGVQKIIACHTSKNKLSMKPVIDEI